MAIIKILQYPDKRLKRKGVKVKEETFKTKAFQKMIDDMWETHYAADNCAALAATQLDIPNAPHVTVIDFSSFKDHPLTLVNAKIVEREGEQCEEEGCMSVGCDIGANVYEKVKRDFRIRVIAQDRHGKEFELIEQGFMAKCIQHELDHLDGLIFLDRVSKLKRQRAEKKLEKLKRNLND